MLLIDVCSPLELLSLQEDMRAEGLAVTSRHTMICLRGYAPDDPRSTRAVCCFIPCKTYARIKLFFVPKPYRGRGYGTHIFQACLEHIRRLNFQYVVGNFRPAAFPIVRKVGFRVIKTYKNGIQYMVLPLRVEGGIGCT